MRWRSRVRRGRDRRVPRGRTPATTMLPQRMQVHAIIRWTSMADYVDCDGVCSERCRRRWSVIEDEVEGCTDEIACNFIPEATTRRRQLHLPRRVLPRLRWSVPQRRGRRRTLRRGGGADSAGLQPGLERRLLLHGGRPHAPACASLALAGWTPRAARTTTRSLVRTPATPRST